MADKEEDLVFKSVHLWVSDIQKFFSTRLPPEEMKTVVIVGTIIDVISPGDLENTRRPVGYWIDDGTGVIKASQFVQNRFSIPRPDQPRPGDLPPEIGNAVDNLVRMTEEAFEKALCPLPIGATVEVKGKIQQYNDKTELLAFSVKEIKDPKLELERMMIVDRLKQDVYPSRFFSA